MGIINNIQKFFIPNKVKTFLSALLGGSPARPVLNGKRLLDIYDTSAYVRAAAHKRAEKVGQIDFELFQVAKDGTKRKIEDPENPMLKVLYKPNKYQTKNEFFELYQLMKDLTGSVFVWMVRPTEEDVPAEMHILRSDLVEIKLDAEGDISHFLYRIQTGKAIKFQPHEILFSQYPSPSEFTNFRGSSPLMPGQLAVNTEEQLSIYQNNILQNGGRIEGILEMPLDNMTKEQIESVREQFEEEYSGAKRAGRPMVSYGGMKYSNLGLTPTELSYSQSKKDIRDDILLLFGVPKVLVAQTDDVNYSTIEEAHKIFLQETIKPLLDNIEQKFNEFAVPAAQELQYIDPLPENQDAKIKYVESGLNAGYLTTNEARATFGLEPVEGGDTLLVTFSKAPISVVADDGSSDPAAPAATDPNAKGLNGKKEFAHPLKTKAIRDVYRKSAEVRQLKNERRFLRAFRRYLKDQKGRMVKYLDGIPSNGKAWKKKNIIDDAFNMDLEVSLGKDIVTPLLLQMAAESGKDTLEMVGQSGYKFSEAIVATLQKRAQFFLGSVSETTFKELQNAFAASIEAGEGRDQLVRRVEKVYGDIERSRARTIARTETHVAVQEGVLDGYDQGNVPVKIWVTVEDSATRESHAEIDGEEKPVDAAFSNGLMYPGDVSGSPEETVNCRCSV